MQLQLVYTRDTIANLQETTKLCIIYVAVSNSVAVMICTVNNEQMRDQGHKLCKL